MIRVKRPPPWTLTLCVCLVIGSATPADAYWDDVHYYLTYYVARLVGYTPPQAYRLAAADLCTDYHKVTEPTQVADPLVDPFDLLTLTDPPQVARQNPRWWFHAFRNQTDPRFRNAIGDAPGAAEADAAIAEQRLALFHHGTVIRNPGVFLHFLQDEACHKGFGSVWGHWFHPLQPLSSSAPALNAGLPLGGSVDWLDFDRDPIEFPTAKAAAVDLVRDTALWLDRFMDAVSPRQKPRKFSIEEAEEAIDALLELGPAPAPLTAADLQSYIDYRQGKVAGLTAEQIENFRKHEKGPDLQRAEQTINAALRSMGMVEYVIPKNHLAAQKQYRFGVTGTGNVWPVDDQGELSQQATDDWVLTGTLKLDLQPDGSGAQDPVEVRIKSPSTLLGQPEYDLVEPTRMNVGSSTTWQHLPIGEVTVELHRDSWLLSSTRVELKKAENETTVRVAPTFDWTGSWNVEYEPNRDGKWYSLGVMTWRKVPPKEAVAVLQKELRNPTLVCGSATSLGTAYAYFLGEFPWGGGGKMIGYACNPFSGSLTGRYGYTSALSSGGSGPGQGSILIVPSADGRSFEGSYVEDQSNQPHSRWRGTRTGP